MSITSSAGATRLTTIRLGAGLIACAMALPATAAPLLLSANDGIQTFADGAYKVRPGKTEGSLSGFDLAVSPPKPLWRIPLEQTAVGPPNAIAVSPTGDLALVASPATIDPKDTAKVLPGQDLQIIDLTANPASVTKLPLDHHPWGVAIAPDGRHGLVADGDGTVTWLAIDGKAVSVAQVITIGTPASRITNVAFSKDGRWALVARRGDDLVTLMKLDGAVPTVARDITVGSNPYEIVVSPDGRLAAVSNVGRTSGDRDSISLIDLQAPTIRTIGVFSVGPTPEGMAFSPDSRRIAVNSINGSNLKPGNPLRSDHSLIQLFDLTQDGATLAGTAALGVNAQGLAFTPDGQSVVVQDYATDSLVTLRAGPHDLTDTGARIQLDAGPAALALTPSQTDAKP